MNHRALAIQCSSSTDPLNIVNLIIHIEYPGIVCQQIADAPIVIRSIFSIRFHKFELGDDDSYHIYKDQLVFHSDVNSYAYNYRGDAETPESVPKKFKNVWGDPFCCKYCLNL